MRILNKSFGSIVEPKPANLHLVVFINCKNADSAIILIKPYPYLATIMCNSWGLFCQVLTIFSLA